jgi:hypothetical protein
MKYPGTLLPQAATVEENRKAVLDLLDKLNKSWDALTLGPLSLAGPVTIAGAVSVGGALTVTGVSAFTGAVSMASTLTLSTMTPGSVLFAGAGGLVSQDNTNLFWDDAANHLHIPEIRAVGAAGLKLFEAAGKGLLIADTTGDGTFDGSVTIKGTNLLIDHILEYTAAHGVNIDGVLLKDNFVNSDKVMAQTAAGLSLFEDGGKGIFIQDATGNIGIGMVFPASRLTIDAGTAIAAIEISGKSSAHAVQDLYITRTSSSESIVQAPNIYFSDGTANNTIAIQAGLGSLQFFNYGSGSWLERMRISPTGNVGIGTAAPDARGEIETITTEGAQALTIDQNDIDMAFIDFQGESEAGAAKNLSSWTVAALNGYIKVEINGTAKWLAYYNAPTS